MAEATGARTVDLRRHSPVRVPAPRRLGAEAQARARGPERLQLKMWLYPYLTILTIVLVVALIASSMVDLIADTRIQLALSLLSAGLVLLAYFVFRRGRSGGGSCPDAARTSDVRAGSEER